MRTFVTVPDELFQRADDLARRLGISRSRLYGIALERFLRRHDDAEVTSQLDKVYSTQPSDLDPTLARIQALSIERY